MVRVASVVGATSVRVILSLDETEPGLWHRHASIAAHGANGAFVRVEAAALAHLLPPLGFVGEDVRAARSEHHGGAVWHYFEEIPNPHG